jgi:hypothetical protein
VASASATSAGSSPRGPYCSSPSTWPCLTATTLCSPVATEGVLQRLGAPAWKPAWIAIEDDERSASQCTPGDWPCLPSTFCIARAVATRARDGKPSAAASSTIHERDALISQAHERPCPTSSVCATSLWPRCVATRLEQRCTAASAQVRWIYPRNPSTETPLFRRARKPARFEKWTTAAA